MAKTMIMIYTTMETTTNISNISAADKDFLRGPEGFFERYIRNLAYYTKCIDAYERTEAQYIALTGAPRYQSYGSFRAAYSRFCKR